MKTFKLHPVGGSFRLLDEEKKPLARMNKFLEAIEVRGLSKQTVRAYGYDLLHLARWLRRTKKSWKNFTQRDLVSYIQFQRGHHAGEKSINRRLTTCELYYKFCFAKEAKESRGLSRPSPFYKGRGRDRDLGLFHLSRPHKIKIRVKEAQPIIEILTPHEMKIFLATAKKYRDLAMMYLMLLCGLRFSEVLWLKVGDLSLNEEMIKVLGKGRKERLLPVPAVLLEILQKYLHFERPTVRLDHEPLFVNLQGPRSGQAMTPAGLRSLFRSRRQKSGIKKANPHRLRHTFATRMAAENVSLPALQKLMGHADITTTLHYVNLSTADLKKEFERAMKEIQGDYGQKTASS